MIQPRIIVTTCLDPKMNVEPQVDVWLFADEKTMLKCERHAWHPHVFTADKLLDFCDSMGIKILADTDSIEG